MTVFLWGITAWEIWRAGRVAAVPTRVLPQPGSMPIIDARLSEALIEAGVTPGQIHVEVADARTRPRRRGVIAHVRGQALPRGAYHRLESLSSRCGTTVYASIPEAIFVQMATCLPPLEAVALGCELTAGYVLRPHAENGFTWRPPPATRRSLERFVDRCEGTPGIKAARRALPLIAEGALSPPEAKAALMSGLSTRLGGYGLGIPLLNCSPDGRSQTLAIIKAGDSPWGIGAYACDALWPKHGIALEYHGKRAHGPNRLAHDAIRQARLGSGGIDVVPLAHEQLADARLFHEAMMAVFQKAGIRWRCTVPDFRKRHYRLRQALSCLSTGTYHLRRQERNPQPPSREARTPDTIRDEG